MFSHPSSGIFHVVLQVLKGTKAEKGVGVKGGSRKMDDPRGGDVERRWKANHWGIEVKEI